MLELPPIPPVDWRDAARRFLAHYPEVNSTSEVNHVIETMPNNGAQNVQDSSDMAKRSQDRSLSATTAISMARLFRRSPQAILVRVILSPPN
jgi:cell envelope opacity-associated protein A